MKSNSIAVLIFLLVKSVGFAQDRPCEPRKHAKLPAIVELTYAKARKRLLAAGWQPLQTKSFNEGEHHLDTSQGNGPLFWRRGYVELEVCSGTGVAACGFLFKDAYGNRLRVTTAGKELPASRARARVTGFRFVCEDPKSATRTRLRPSRVLTSAAKAQRRSQPFSIAKNFSEPPDAASFEFSAGGFRYRIAGNGKGRRSGKDKQLAFNLRVDRSDYLTHNLYFCEYEGDLLLIGEVSDSDLEWGLLLA